jgi:hypothetical protein
VEVVYPEGLDVLLARLHADVSSAYLCGVLSQLESARFDEAIELIEEALLRSVTGRDEPTSGAADADSGAVAELEELDAYARGMQAFLRADYARSTAKLEEWLDRVGEKPDASQVDYAIAAMSRIPQLASATNRGETTAAAARLAARLAALRATDA